MGRNVRQTESQSPDAQLSTESAPQVRPRSPWQSWFFRSPGGFTQEQGQALTRVILAALGSIVFFGALYFGHGDEPFMLSLAYLLASIFYLSIVSRHREQHAWRRYLVILLDLAVATYLTAYFSGAGIAFYPLFLWVMIGNGLRYGQYPMQFATLFGLLGFTSAMAISGFLWEQPATYIGLMFGLVLMPKFFVVMMNRLAEANTELKAQRDQAEFMATHDVLTGLPNRAYLHSRLEQTLASARRNRHKVALAFIDLDGFKSINDSFGHEYGDYLLTQVAEAMREVLRSSDTVVRIGGDEFVVVIEDYNDPARIGQVIERLFGCVGRYYTIGEYETYVTWSCGVALYPGDGRDVHTLLKNADTAMYAAKSRGPNHFAFYDNAMSEEVSHQLALRDEMRSALDKDEFEVYYQPIIESATGRITSTEALLRWHHPKHGTLLPGSFIEVAEQSGLINQIGDWVLREAMMTAARWQAEVDYSVSMHVNVSAHQLKQDDFAAKVGDLLKETDLPSCVLDLEMTESALLQDVQRAERLLDELKTLGVKIALDDFGTGFSSLAYLKRLPVDTIKIDKTFIDDIPADQRDCALVDTILNLGRELGKGVVAEGVETEQQRDWLLAHRCAYLQGYLFSRPVPKDKFFALSSATYLAARQSANGQN